MAKKVQQQVDSGMELIYEYLGDLLALGKLQARDGGTHTVPAYIARYIDGRYLLRPLDKRLRTLLWDYRILLDRRYVPPDIQLGDRVRITGVTGRKNNTIFVEAVRHEK
jgi:hypothetical protein